MISKFSHGSPVIPYLLSQTISRLIFHFFRQLIWPSVSWLQNFRYKLSSIQRHVYEPTIQFQISNFAEFLHLVYCINPNIKVIGVLLPKYYVVEETEHTVNQLWKPYFENIVSSFQENYANFMFCDLKNLTDISHNPDFYQDLTHLNFEGARHLTNYIVSAISEHSWG